MGSATTHALGGLTAHPGPKKGSSAAEDLSHVTSGLLQLHLQCGR